MNEVLRVRATWFEKPRTLRIDDEFLLVTPLTPSGAPASSHEAIPLGGIAEVRLSHYPARFQSNRYRVRLTTGSGATLTFSNAFYQGAVSETDFSAEYRAFVIALCRSVARANPAARFLRGRAQGAMLLENGILAALFLVMLGVFAWLRPEIHWFQVLQIVLVVVYVPLAVISYRKNRPGIFDPKNPPDEVLPK